MVLSLVATRKCGGLYIGRCAEEEQCRRVECCWDCSFAPSSFLPTVSGGVRTAKLAYLRPTRHVVHRQCTPCADNRMGSLRLTDTTGDLQETITLLLHVDRWEVGLFFAVAWGTHGRQASEGKLLCRILKPYCSWRALRNRPHCRLRKRLHVRWAADLHGSPAPGSQTPSSAVVKRQDLLSMSDVGCTECQY
jgi:hypothetical protein